jgi:FMN-dependent oxidoreductase (nitrilotriacetate monooxygenase family)
MILNGFKQPTVGHTAVGLWRHPQAQAHRYKEISYWMETARLLELANFDSLFIPDVLGVLDVYDGTIDAALKHGVQTPSLDPLLIVSAMAAVTRFLGFAITVSTTYEQPYNLARKLTTLDHLTDGRIGWNIVTSALESAARNLGLVRQIPHNERYRIAEEFMEVMYKLWEGSWEEDAVRIDREAGIYADPARVHSIGHVGQYYRVPDAFLAEPSPQRTPLLFQAGTSEEGRKFAARHAEAVLLSGDNPQNVRAVVDDIRHRAESNGRDSEGIKFFAILTVVADDNDEAAARKLKEYRSYASLEGQLARQSAILQVDLSRLGPDDPIELVETEGIRGALQMIARSAPDQRTLRKFAESRALSGGGITLTGSPQTVADKMEEWMNLSGVDGFNVSDPLPLVSYREFAEFITPELTKRGRMHNHDDAQTFRENLFGAGRRTLGQDHPAARFRIDSK